MKIPTDSTGMKHKHCEHCGKGRQKCSHCEHASIKGMAPRQGLCPYHWALKVWGKPWADSCHPTRAEV